MDSNGDGVDENLDLYELDDIYIVGGCGIDIPMTRKIFFTVSGFFNWNLTPVPTNPLDYEGVDVTQYLILLKAGIGIKL